MTRLLFCAFLMISTLIGKTALADDLLKNADIIKMSQSKVSNQLIITKIKASQSQFDVTTSGIKTLLASGVNSSILEQMLIMTKQTDVLTNTDVIELHNAKLSNKLLKQKITASRSRFDTSTDGMIQLKNAKVPDMVVQAMMSKPADSSR